MPEEWTAPPWQRKPHSRESPQQFALAARRDAPQWPLLDRRTGGRPSGTEATRQGDASRAPTETERFSRRESTRRAIRVRRDRRHCRSPQPAAQPPASDASPPRVPTRPGTVANTDPRGRHPRDDRPRPPQHLANLERLGSNLFRNPRSGPAANYSTGPSRPTKSSGTLAH